MNMGRPRTLLGMVLMGLAFVTVPLLVAVGNAMIKLGELAAESEVVLADSATATLENQRLNNLLETMERNALLYFELQDVASASDRLTFYDRDQAALEASIAALRELPSEAPIRDQLARLSSISKDVHRILRTRAIERPVAAVSERFGMLREATQSRHERYARTHERAPRDAAGKHALGAAGARVALGRPDPRHARARRLVLVARRPAAAAGRPRHSRARRRRFQPADHRQRPARHRDSRPPARVAAASAQGVDATRRTSSCATCRTSSRRRSRISAKARSSCSTARSGRSTSSSRR